MAIFKSLLAVTLAAIMTAQAAPQLEARVSVTTWIPIGCWSDNPSRRTLKAATFTNSTFMGAQKCVDLCQNQSSTFNLAGLENGNECWCSTAMDNGPSPMNDSQCSTPCAGNSVEKCGGPNAINAFRNNNIVTV